MCSFITRLQSNIWNQCTLNKYTRLLSKSESKNRQHENTTQKKKKKKCISNYSNFRYIQVPQDKKSNMPKIESIRNLFNFFTLSRTRNWMYPTNSLFKVLLSKSETSFTFNIYLSQIRTWIYPTNLLFKVLLHKSETRLQFFICLK